MPGNVTRTSSRDFYALTAARRPMLVLCGAGVSMIPPTNLPSGNQLRDLCVKHLLSDSYSSQVVGKILDNPAYQRILPEIILQDLAVYCPTHLDRLMVKLLGGAPANSLHLYLSHKHNLIFTTNFDTCFEDVGAQDVVHLHGSIKSPQTLQNRIYRLGKGDRSLYDRFASTIRNADLLVIGYSMRDQDIVNALQQAPPKNVYYLSYDGCIPESLECIPSSVNYCVASAFDVFCLAAQQPNDQRVPNRLAFRRPTADQRCASLLNVHSQIGDADGAIKILKHYLPRLRGRLKYKCICIVANDLRIAGRYMESIRLVTKFYDQGALNLPQIVIFSHGHIPYWV